MYDIELSSDRYELEQAYALECNMEEAMEELRQGMEELREEWAKYDALILEIEARDAARTSTPTAQTPEETAMFTEWLS